MLSLVSDRVMLGRSSSRFNRCFPSYSYSVSTTGFKLESP